MKLLIKAPNWIGDAVMATPAVAYLRAALPHATITVLARRGPAGVWAHHPDVDHCIVADDRHLEADLWRELQKQQFDAAILLTNSFRSAWLVWRLGVPRRFGYNRAGRAWLLTDLLPFRPREWQTPTPQPISRKSLRPTKKAITPRHMVEYYLDLAAVAAMRLGSTLPPPQVDRNRHFPQLAICVRPEARHLVDEFLAGQHIDGSRPLIGICPGAAYGGAKRWPLDKLAAAGEQLARELDASLIVVCGPAELELAQELKRMISVPSCITAELDIGQVAALIERLALFIGNDSGLTHLAAAVRTPLVVVYGPTDWNVTCPWSPFSTVVRKSPACAPCFLRECPRDHRCMLAVEPEDVVQAARQLLDRCGEMRHAL